MQPVSLGDIVIAALGSGGALWFLIKKITTYIEIKQRDNIESKHKKIDMDHKKVEHDLSNKENFQEKITYQLINRFLEQFSSYQAQNEKFQEFFFERLDPMLTAIQKNTAEVRKLSVESDVSQRMNRELVESHKTLSIQVQSMLALITKDSMRDELQIIVPEKTEQKVRAKIHKRKVEITKEEEAEQAKIFEKRT